MSETNGQKPESARVLRERRRLVIAEMQLERVRQAKRLTEDIGWDAYPDYRDFGGTDLFVRARTDGMWLPVGPSTPQDRRHGQDWPIYRTEIELDRIRQQGRLLCRVNSFAAGLLRNRTNYTIGKGFSYKAIARNLPKGQPVPEDVKKLIDMVQLVVDRFLETNRWNASVTPEHSLVLAQTREQEIYRRVCRDGEAFLRFWFEPRGRTMVRPIEPEVIRNPPGAVIHNGETFGIRHQMDPYEDVETRLAYFLFWQDPSTVTEKDRTDAIGQWVEAKYVLHLLGPTTDCSVKRGISDFSYDVARSLERAAKLQRNISIGCADRAVTSEIIQFKGYTQQQVSAYAGGETDRTYQDPVTGKNVSEQHRLPGQRRMIPANMEFVQPPSDNSTPAYMQGLAGDLRQANACFAAPEYWTGDASNGTYSSLESASAPPVRNGETEQEYYRTAFSAVLWRAIKWAVECGELPPDAAKRVDLQVEAPAIMHRNELEKAQADSIKVQGGWKSPQTCAMEDGLDPETELRNTEEFKERTGGQGQPLDDGSGMDDGEPKPPKPMKPKAVQESAEPKHKPPGEGGGQFTSDGGSGGKSDHPELDDIDAALSASHGKRQAKLQARIAKEKKHVEKKKAEYVAKAKAAKEAQAQARARLAEIEAREPPEPEEPSEPDEPGEEPERDDTVSKVSGYGANGAAIFTDAPRYADDAAFASARAQWKKDVEQYPTKMQEYQEAAKAYKVAAKEYAKDYAAWEKEKEAAEETDVGEAQQEADEALDKLKQAIEDFGGDDADLEESRWLADGEDAQHHLHADAGSDKGGQFVAKPTGGAADKGKSEKKYGKSKANLSDASSALVSESTIKKIFGKDVPLEDIPSMVGAPDDAKVYLESVGGDTIRAEIHHPAFKSPCIRLIKYQGGGAKPYIKNEFIEIKPEFQGNGLGSEIFGRQVENVRGGGFSHIECHAARQGGDGNPNRFNGYYTWPRCGYNSYFDDIANESKEGAKVAKAAWKKFDGVESILELMTMPGGAEWWKKNGCDLFDAKFNLEEGSASLATFDAYESERAARPKKEK